MASRSRSCSRGVKKSGGCKRKAGPKRSRSRRSRSRSRSRSVRRSRSRSRSRRSRSRKVQGGAGKRRSGRRSRSRKSRGGKGGDIYCVKCRRRTATNDLVDTCIAGKGGKSRNAETGTCIICGIKKIRFKKGEC
jgi:hypothetical protein